MGNSIDHCSARWQGRPEAGELARETCELRAPVDCSPASVRDIPDLNAAPSITDDSTIEYLTDVEGNWEYFVNFVWKSKILYWEGDPLGVWGPGKLSLRPNGILVFGGDAPDKGPGDIRFIKTLVSMKKRYPSQVFIVLGNRDLMKMRFAAELAEGYENLENPWLPPWLPPKQVTLEAFLKDRGLELNAVGKLKWMLHCNMGCQDTTFDTRKHELSLLYGTATDADVLRSYLSSIDPRCSDPWMLEFLRAGQIAVVLGDTLFVHGGLQDESLGHVPGRTTEFTDVSEWALALNAWKDQQLAAFEKDPYWRVGPDGGLLRGGADLIEYGTPGAGNRTVIYYNPFNNGNPQKRSLKVREFLRKSGIRRTFSGHQPHGQTPTVVRHIDTGLLAITADTSYSDARGSSKVFNPANCRGLAVAILRIKGPWVFCEGRMSDGAVHGWKLHVDASMDELPDALVGRQLVDESWVKTIVREADGGDAKGSDPVLAAVGRGFTVTNHFMPVQKACLKLTPEYGAGSAFAIIVP